MKKSKIFSLNLRDWLKGLYLALLSAIITFLVSELQADSAIDISLLKRIGMVALITFLSYLAKNFTSNSNGDILTSEPKRV